MDKTLFNHICVGSFLAICTATDIKTRRVFLAVLAVFGIAGIAGLVMYGGSSLPGILGGIGIGAVMIGISLATGGAVGMGDGLVLAVAGLYLGFAGNVELLAGGLFLAAAYSIFLLAVRRAGRKKEVPFIPFLFLAFLGTMFFQGR